MNMIYISHPYTGNEKDNRKAAAAIAAELAKKYPYILFVNPLDAMRHLKAAGIPYDTVLEQCKTLLGKCDGAIMAGNRRRLMPRKSCPMTAAGRTRLAKNVSARAALIALRAGTATIVCRRQGRLLPSDIRAATFGSRPALATKRRTDGHDR